MSFPRIVRRVLFPECIIKRNVSNNIEKHNIISQNKSIETNALQCVSEDLSVITPHFPKTFNIAAYVNSSETLQNLVKLNVNLSKIEKKPYIVEKILRLDFEKDIKNHILFIKDYIGMDGIEHFITKNPLFLCEDIEDLEVRVNYLQSKHFTDDQIRRIITKNPFWLMFSTIRIDRRLGYFQGNFDLSGEEIRQLVTKQPNIITYNLHHIKTNLFVIKEEMGFHDYEIKQLILCKPKLWMMNQKSLLERFNYFHNVIQISHRDILKFPEVLFCRNFKVKQRHLFLKSLGRAQYDPQKENFVSIKALVEGTDVDFCKNYAKCNVTDFNIFLKTI